MSKKAEFIKFIEDNTDFSNASEDVMIYWAAMKGASDEDKPPLTDNGKLILGYMQQHLNDPMMKSRDIAEGLFMSSRIVSGSMRKLVTDGFVEKVGENPVIYSITEKGKTFKID